ncbi:uncharacterized protein LOC133191551 [Saccostrea echinata]|uniref:uncharacterized protein LOC133191551 n=1 Tax=Saccostrea echinata TaxID=191078 RepID=UPI002A8226F2|nr:uncharacterized protein LOC133191551 [Saccostrea echinata]
MVVLVTTSSTISEFLIDGQRGTRLSVKHQKCSWNTTIGSSGITVETSLPSVLYVESRKSTFIVPSLQSLGNVYVVQTLWNELLTHQNGKLESWFVISAPRDFTTVYINLDVAKQFMTWFLQADTYQFLLNKDDSVYVRCNYDVSGIMINGSKPLFVAMGTIYKDNDMDVTIPPSNQRWGQRFFIDETSSYKIFGNANTSLKARTASNKTKTFDYAYFPAYLSQLENESSPFLLEFSKPVLVLQLVTIEHYQGTIFKSKYVTPISLYIPTNLFEDDRKFCFQNLSLASSQEFPNTTKLSRKIINIEKEQFSSISLHFNSSETHSMVKKLQKKHETFAVFSGYIYCGSSTRLYPLPAAWHIYSCETNLETMCTNDVNPSSNGPTLIHLIHDPYIAASIASVTFSLVSGLLAAVVFIALMYLVDQIRTRLVGPTRVGPLIP